MPCFNVFRVFAHPHDIVIPALSVDPNTVFPPPHEQEQTYLILFWLSLSGTSETTVNSPKTLPIIGVLFVFAIDKMLLLILRQ